MKKIYGFAALCAAMTLASCSNENEPNNVVPGAGDGIEKAYIAINIAPPAEGTRAAVDAVTGTTHGTVKAEEYAVANVQFALFNESKKLISITDRYTDFQWKSSSISDVDRESETKVLEINQTANEAQDKVAYVMAIVNSPDLKDATNFGFTTGGTASASSLDDVRNKMGEFKSITSGGKTYLVMTNSAHVCKEKKTATNTNGEDYYAYATSFVGHVYPTYGQALEDAQDIYVERVAARVDITNKADDTKENVVTLPNTTTVDGKTAAVTVNIDGVEFIYAANKSSLVKDIDGVSITDAWYTSGSHRTHWGATSNLNWKAAPPTGTDDSDYARAYYSTARTNGAVDATTKSFYLNENIPATGNNAKPTYVVITGTIHIDGADDATELYQLYQDGKYYTKDGAKQALCGFLHQNGYYYYYEDGDVKSKATVDHNNTNVKIVASATTDYEGYIQVPATVKDSQNNVLTLRDKTGAVVSGADSDGQITMVADVYKTLVYGGGNTYYYCPIQPDAEDAQGGKIGVVRNHIYDLDITSISGLGVPLFDPSNELLPKDPEVNHPTPKWYFGTSIKILSWKAYTQDLKFDTPVN